MCLPEGSREIPGTPSSLRKGSGDPSQDGSKSLPRNPKGPQKASRKMSIHPLNGHRTCTQCVQIRNFVFERFWSSALKIHVRVFKAET